MKLSLIFPCFNEELAIESVLKEAKEWREKSLKSGLLSEVEIIVVDDGSTDNSYKKLLEQDSIQIARHGKNRGYGAAIKTGMKLAQNEWLCFYDFDNTCKPDDINSMITIANTKHSHHIIGNRLHPHSKMPKVRKTGNYFYQSLCTLFFGKPKLDTCSGFRLFHSELKEEFLKLPDGLNFSLAMTLLGLKAKNPPQQTPIDYRDRTGVSKLNAFKHGIQFLNTIVMFALTKRF